MKAQKKLILIALILTLLLGACARAEETQQNIVYNGDFEEIADNGLPYDWQKDMWLSNEGYTYIETTVEAYSGNYALKIENIAENDARVEQYIPVTPGQLYRLSVMVNVFDAVGGGASISFADNYVRSETVYDTDGEWVELECYAMAGEGQESVGVWLRLGGYGENTSGVAVFDDFRVVPVDAAPPEMAILSMEDDDSFADYGGGEVETEEDGGDPPAQPGRNQALLVLLSAVYFLAVIFASSHVSRVRMNDDGFKICFFAVLLYSLVMRLFVAYTQPGYGVDVSCFLSWGDRFAATGPVGFYDPDVFCDYPPLYMIVLGLLSGIRQLFGLDGHSGLANIIMRLVPTLCDLALAYGLYRVARRNHSERNAVVFASAYAVMPAFIAASAAWGQIDPVLLLLLFLAIERVIAKKYLGGLLLFTVAMLVKPQALMLAPMGVAKLLCDYLLAKGPEKKRTGRSILLSLGAAIGLCVVVSIVFGIGQHPLWLVQKYAETLQSYEYVVLNSYNLYAMIGLNWEPLTAGLSMLGTIVIILMVAYGALCYYAARRHMEKKYTLQDDAYALYLCCAVVIAGIFMFGMKMHERYLLPAILLLFAAYAHKKDRRVLLLALVYATTSFINVMIVLYNTHLPTGFDLFTSLLSLANVLATLYLLYIVYECCLRGEKPSVKAETVIQPSAYAPGYMQPAAYKFGMKRREALLLAGLTLVYALLAFTNLGDMEAPQSEYRSSNQYEVVAVDLGEVRQVETLYYYGGVGEGRFGVQISEDGQNWDYIGLVEYPLYDMFKWLTFNFDGSGNLSPKEDQLDRAGEQQLTFERLAAYPLAAHDQAWPDEAFENMSVFAPVSENRQARYIRLTFMSPAISMFEIAFGDAEGNIYPVASAGSAGYTEGREWDAAMLFDEQQYFPERNSNFNSMYFDEIYHANTAYEHIHGLYAHEWTHPPLGKVLIAVGIQIFGMTPFGWRFMGAFFGVLMVPLMYLFAKQVFRRRDIAFLLTILFTFDFMHFTQTRLATIDTYGVFFIMAMYLFMFRYARMNFNRDGLKKTLPTLALCGLMFGLGAASKWICLYAGAGLAVIFFILMAQRWREYAYAKKRVLEGSEDEIHARVVRVFPKYLGGTLLFCVLVFVIIPALIYYASYIPHYPASEGGVTLEKVINLQERIYNYHDGVSSTHPYMSTWWEWPLIVKPMFYYSWDDPATGMVAAISALGNPVVWWGGFFCFLYMVWIKVRGRDIIPETGRRSAPNNIFWVAAIGLLFQYAPWILVTRTIFIYHYFASIPFLMLFIGYALEHREQTHPKVWKKAWIFAGAAVLLFALYYPLLSGVPVPSWYAGWLNILPRWTLFSGSSSSFPWMTMWNALGNLFR